MSLKLILKTLHKAITEGRDNETEPCQKYLMDHIEEAFKEPLLYTLPFNQLSSIVKRVDFSELSDPIQLIQSFIRKTNQTHPIESVLLLNDFSCDKLPLLTIDEIIEIISQFTNCELLARLGELQEEEKSLLVYDYPSELERLNRELKDSNRKVSDLERLIEYEPDIFKAVKKGKLLSVHYSIENLSTNKEIKNNDGMTLLNCAALYNQLSITQYLCEKQHVNKETPNNDGDTALYTASIKGNLDIVKYLCKDQRVNKEAANKDGDTALHAACKLGHLEIVKGVPLFSMVNEGNKNIIKKQHGVKTNQL